MDLLDVMARGTRTEEATEGRIFELVAGVVTSVDDPKKLGRVKARLSGQQDEDCSDWLMPCFMGGSEARPLVNDPIIVGFLGGDPNRGVFWTTVTTRQKGRPTEHMVLGDSAIGLLNDLASKVQTLIGKYNAVVTDLTTLGTLLTTTGLTVTGALAKGTFNPTATADGDVTSKGKAADGSVVPAKSQDTVALSATQVVR